MHGCFLRSYRDSPTSAVDYYNISFSGSRVKGCELSPVLSLFGDDKLYKRGYEYTRSTLEDMSLEAGVQVDSVLCLPVRFQLHWEI